MPGTAEEFLGNGLGPTPENQKKWKGVTWWSRSITIPNQGARVRLCFESARVRSEVYLDHHLVGYNLIEGTPFEVDLTAFVRAGETHRLDVRVTNPGGSYAWSDSYPGLAWGKHLITQGRGFGGLTGRVRLIATDPVYIDDIYCQNTPEPHVANAILTVRNANDSPVHRRVTVRVTSRAKPEVEVFTKELADVTLVAGDSTVTVPINAPQAQLWDLDHPNLYVCHVALNDAAAAATTDSDDQTFGFRWFAPVGVGTDAMLKLNDKRIVLRSAISWGMWPITGLVPTPELAERQVRAAKALGLNMLNFHRCIGQPPVLDKADELGLLYYEEPGGYQSAGADAFARDYATAKLLRMVRRDRSHPSLIIYNLINEYGGAKTNPEVYARQGRDMAAAHAEDPSRQIVFASGWAGKPGVEEPVKLHMRPFDDHQYHVGWFDTHRAGGPATWSDNDYHSPTNNAFANNNRGEELFWGEECAISTPPRLGLIRQDLANGSTRLGWDGAVYLEWAKQFDAFLDRKSLRSSLPTVDALCAAMGAVSLNNQGRRIELARMQDVTDGYVVNGWDATIIDNHSGIVDAFRNPKADPSLMARFNQPVYVAVRPRSQVAQVQDGLAVDFFAVNEVNLHGPFTLNMRATSADGREIFTKSAPVTLAGGDRYGQSLVENIAVPLNAKDAGMINIQGALLDPSGKTRATGSEQALAVDWQDENLAGNGAVYEWGTRIGDFLRTRKNVAVPSFDDTQAKLDWIVIARPPQEAPEPVPASALRDPSGAPGLRTSVYADADKRGTAVVRADAAVDFQCVEGATPDPAIHATNGYSLTWEGQLNPTATGSYLVGLDFLGGARLSIDGKQLIDAWPAKNQLRHLTAPIDLVAGKPVSVRVELSQHSGASSIRLLWSPPNRVALDPQKLFERAKAQGTTLLFVDYAANWLDLVQRNSAVHTKGSFTIGHDWIGGQYFVRDHPLFRDLPVNVALDWPYQRVVQIGPRTGLQLEGEELVAGCYNSWPLHLGTAVGVVDCGTGRVVLSTLDIASNLAADDGPTAVARKLLCNYIRFATSSRR